jgi:hypothetical protein
LSDIHLKDTKKLIFNSPLRDDNWITTQDINMWYNSENSHTFFVGGTFKAVLTGDGLGIGSGLSAIPLSGYRLSVDGNISASGDIYKGTDKYILSSQTGSFGGGGVSFPYDGDISASGYLDVAGISSSADIHVSGDIWCGVGKVGYDLSNHMRSEN